MGDQKEKKYDTHAHYIYIYINIYAHTIIYKGLMNVNTHFSVILGYGLGGGADRT